jgi:hypothetical protein
MKRTYISPEYQYNNVYGTFNMKELSPFYGTKMLKIKDKISIDNNTLLYYQEPSGEQLIKPNNELLNTLSLDDLKLNNHTKVLNIKNINNPILILNINYIKILREYLFTILKKNKTFLGVLNNFTINKNVNSNIYDYIDLNILNKYNIPNIDLFISYNSIIDNNTNLKYNVTYNPNIMNISNIRNKFSISTDIINNVLTLTYNQEQNSNLYNFDYYFNIYFNKL